MFNMKKVFISIAAIAFSISAFAGGFLTNTNQSARFLRNPFEFIDAKKIDVTSLHTGIIFYTHGNQ